MVGPSSGTSIALRDMANAYRVSQAIRVATVLGIADHLADGPRSSNELAMMTGSHADALYRLLRALASSGIVHENPGQQFSLTSLGTGLRRDVPDSVADWVLFTTGSNQWATWRELEHSVRTGENGFQHLHGIDSWTYRQQHPEVNTEFDLAMSCIARLTIASLLPVYDFGRFGTIVDVGGGNGALLAAILAKYPLVHGILYDQPHVVAGAGTVVDRAGVADRCDVVAGDFFESVPAGGDAYVLKSIVHDWEDREVRAILATCRRAMTDGTTLLVIERELGEPNSGSEGKYSDLNMLLGPGGRERTIPEFANLFDASGFRYLETTSGSFGFGIHEGIAI